LYNGAHPFDQITGETVTVRDPADLKESNSILVIWGGSDIGAHLYNHPESITTSPYPSRDKAEWALLHRAIEMEIPIIGVCRGAQMLCAAAGGFLLQDVKGHLGSHTIDTYVGQQLKVNSIHHQMLAGLETVDHEMLAWSTKRLSNRYIYKDDQTYEPPIEFVEPECVNFPAIKGFAVQWHPEMMAEDAPSTKFVLSEFKQRYFV